MKKYKLWKLEDIKQGIDRFYQENGRFPTVSDLDNINYLPSSRWIQYKFGGMVKVRKDLGFEDIHLGKGKYRTQIALKANKDGLEFEHEIERFLIDKFGEPFVHIQKRIGMDRDTIDFYIYSAMGNFGVDVTNVTGHFRNVALNTNSKIRKYNNLNLELYIVVSGNYKQAQIDRWLLRKAIPLPYGWKILTKQNFIKVISTFKSHSISAG